MVLDKFDRLRRRLNMLRTKGGELTEAERAWIEHIENVLTEPET